MTWLKAEIFQACLRPTKGGIFQIFHSKRKSGNLSFKYRSSRFISILGHQNFLSGMDSGQMGMHRTLTPNNFKMHENSRKKITSPVN